MRKIIFLMSFMTFFMSSISIFAFSPSSSVLLDGIDVSYWQGNIDYESVADAGIDAVYIRSSVGSSYIDPNFERNYTGFTDADVNIGFYHYVTAKNVSEAESEADFFASVISSKSYDMPPAMDFEYFYGLNNAQVNDIALTFIQTISRITGKNCVIYSDTYNAANVFDSRLSSYPLWVAQYGVSEPSANGNWSEWSGFQYSDEGRIAGIDTDVDLDRFANNLLDSGSVDGRDTPSSDNNRIVVYFVRPGDTLWAIARRYDTTIREIAGINDISNPDLIFPGERLEIIPGDTVTYTVRAGDTLSAISRRFDVSIQRIVSANSIANPNLIYIGEILTIPLNN